VHAAGGLHSPFAAGDGHGARLLDKNTDIYE
jgi:hypothetical protein